MKKSESREIRNGAWYLVTLGACMAFYIFVWVLIAFAVREARQQTRRNRAILYSGLGALVYSLFLGSFFLMAMVGTEPSPSMVIVWLLAVPAFVVGVGLLGLYFALAVRSAQLQTCLTLVREGHITSLASMAEITGWKQARIAGLLRTLIGRDCLGGAEIDEAHGELLLHRSIWARQRVICKMCGAELVVDFGHTLVCEYCGNALVSR